MGLRKAPTPAPDGPKPQPPPAPPRQLRDILSALGLPVLPFAWSGVVGRLDCDERALLHGRPSGKRPLGVIYAAGLVST
jgi:hypothetical protein